MALTTGFYWFWSQKPLALTQRFVMALVTNALGADNRVLWLWSQKPLALTQRIFMVLGSIYDCPFNRSSFKGVTFPMRHPKSSSTNDNELIIRIEIYVLMKSDKVKERCD
ncbi:hypothetical protein [Prevotella lacticifex]|uniref:hypothetical protein n=1 Tax=Prevotella lacticifex TaxID=2854755 RepID=UPI001CC81622|nr:hypothetical protein [Prevotella lacticifex]